MSFWRSLSLIMVMGVAGSLSAQLKVGDYGNLGLSGTVGANYSGSYGDVANSSSHGVGVSGEGTLDGYYFNPNFLHLNVHPHYGRSQDSGASVNIGTNSGVDSMVNFFSGSNFPGSISYSNARNSTGQFAVPGSSSLVTTGSSNAYGIGWSEGIRGLPHLTVSYGKTASNSSVIGVAGTNVMDFGSLALASSYQWGSWPLSLSYNHITTSSDSATQLTGSETKASSTDSSEQFSTSHSLPFWSGSVSTALSHNGYSYTSQDLATDGSLQTGTGKSNSAGVNSNFTVTQKVSANAQFGYNDNLLGSVNQQLINAGGAPIVNGNGTLRNLEYGGSASWSAPRGILLIGGAARQQQFFQGVEYSSTMAYGNLNYGYQKPLLGSLLFTFGMNDAASKVGNTGAGFFGNVNFTRKVQKFDVTASAAYSQNVQTLATFVTTSGVSYGAGVSRKFFDKLTWHGNFGGGHSAFTGSSSSNHSERYGTGLSFRRVNVNANYGTSHQYALQTSAGLVDPALPIPLLVGANVIMYDSKDYGFSASLELIRHMNVAGAYSKSSGDSHQSGSDVQNGSTVEYLLLRYPFRKISFQASYNWIQQGIITPGNPLHSSTSYTFGIYRWIKAF